MKTSTRSFYAVAAMAMAGMHSVRLGDGVLSVTKAPSGGAPRHRAVYPYPHSSTRQRARYARQLSAGQLNIERV